MNAPGPAEAAFPPPESMEAAKSGRLGGASPPRATSAVMLTPIDLIDWPTALVRIGTWARNRESRYVCICNAHSVVTAARDDAFNKVVHEADMATPDGTSVAWMLRRTGYPEQERINGPDLMWRYCEKAEAEGEGIYLLGSAPETLLQLQLALADAFPNLRVLGAVSPPFRPLSPAEDDELVAHINASNAGVVFVSLGCPKQEHWMADHRGRVQAVMIGVGAAFDFHAGTLARAPQWMRDLGLEWLHRLLSEPRRLWRRYLFTNTAFIVGASRQLAKRKRP